MLEVHEDAAEDDGHHRAAASLIILLELIAHELQPCGIAEVRFAARRGAPFLRSAFTLRTIRRRTFSASSRFSFGRHLGALRARASR